MTEREALLQRLERLRKYIRYLRGRQSLTLEEYLADEDLQAAVERRLQLALECVLDIGSILIAERGLRQPDTYREVMRISSAFSCRCKRASEGNRAQYRLPEDPSGSGAAHALRQQPPHPARLGNGKALQAPQGRLRETQGQPPRALPPGVRAAARPWTARLAAAGEA